MIYCGGVQQHEFEEKNKPLNTLKYTEKEKRLCFVEAHCGATLALLTRQILL